MPTFYAKRRGQTIYPNSPAAALELERLPENRVFRVEAKVPRNGKHHRLVMTLFSYVADALNNGPAPSAVEWTTELVKENVKIAVGCTRETKVRGQIYTLPGSISYDRMDEPAFGKFSTAAMNYIAGDLCPWIKDSPHWPNIREILKGSGVSVE